MHITLDQARAMEAFAKGGSFNAAAKLLRRTHSAVVYSLQQLENQTGLVLFNRTGYRTRLTAQGEILLNDCTAVLAAEARLIRRCEILRANWEPLLTMVFDAIYPLGPAFEITRTLARLAAQTRVQVKVDSLASVEKRFVKDNADLMVTVLPPNYSDGAAIPLPDLKAYLVAHRTHPLAMRKSLQRSELEGYMLLTVREPDSRLQLPGSIERQSSAQLSDFHSKKAAILAGIGYGWLPEWLIAHELKRKELQVLKVAEGNSYVFKPLLITRTPLGRAGQIALEHLSNFPK